MLTIDNTILVVIDVQGKLAEIMHNKENLFANLERIIKGVQVLNIPIIWTEQVPEKLGPTLPQFSELLIDSTKPITKSSFSCCGVASFTDALKSSGRQQILLAGIEAHVCVYQTTLDLLADGYEVQIITDAVSSRTPENRHIALTRMKDAGAILTSTEMALFELLLVAKGPQFKQISRIV